jgi:fatty-acid desaturase
LFGIFTIAHRGSPKKAAVSMGLHSLLVHDVLGLSGGGFVNGVLHRGKGKIAGTLVNQPQPFDSGRYSVNAGPVMSAIMLGEGNHDNHHVDQANLRFHESPLRDPGGAFAQLLIKAGLAKPGSGPRP